ncbi:MAG: sulfatase-like hydrolase/transferase, partial [Planctomycetota bacterium]
MMCFSDCHLSMTARYVLFIIADDWSPISRTYGDPVIETPFVDELSSRSTTFSHAYCTTPSCSASRACILTGIHAHTHGQYGHTHSIHGFSTHVNVPTVPGVLRDNRRYTALLGKDHTAPASVYPWTCKEWPEMTPQGVEASVCKSFEEAKKSGRGGMIMLAPAYPHRMGFGGWGLGQHTAQFNDPRYDLDQIPVPAFLPDTSAVRRDLAGYYGGISRFDALVGGALRALTASGLNDQTLVVVTSDHGMPFPGAKASCYDGGHHCPLI